MKAASPANWREERAARNAGAIVEAAAFAQARWADFLGEGEELLWQGPSQPKLRLTVGMTMAIMVGLCFILLGLIVAMLGHPMSLPFGLVVILGGIVRLFPKELRRYWQQCRVFYSVSNKRAFQASTDWWGQRDLESWPITPDSRFHLVPGDPPSIRFYDIRPGSHAEFKAIPEATEVHNLLKRIQKDAA